MEKTDRAWLYCGDFGWSDIDSWESLYSNMDNKTDPGFAGNTATNTLKPATLETGCEIKVPLFINEGDMIRVDTRTGEYMERA